MRWYGYIIAATVIFLGGWIGGFFFSRPAVEGVIQKPVQWESGIVRKDPTRMNEPEKTAELTRYYTEEPSLDIRRLDRRTIRAEAGLGDRTWSRDATIDAEEWHNLIMVDAGYLWIEDGFYPYGRVGYYRYFGRIALGGSLFGSPRSLGAGIGAGYAF